MKKTILFLAILSFALAANAEDCNKFNTIDYNGTTHYILDNNGNTRLCFYSDYNKLAIDLNQQIANIELYRQQCNQRIQTEQTNAANAIQANNECQTQNNTLTISNQQLTQANLDLNAQYISKTNACLEQQTQNTQKINSLNTAVMSWMLGDKAAYEQKINSDNKELLQKTNETQTSVIAITIIFFIYLAAKTIPKIIKKTKTAIEPKKQATQEPKTTENMEGKNQ